MADNVHYLASRQDDIGHFFRLGHTGYRILENLLAAGKLPIKRAVVDASHMDKQKDLINSLQSDGAEIILDLKAAELATPGGFATSAAKLPWAHKNRQHLYSDFTRRNIIDYCEKIAEYAVVHHIDVVHCATHEIAGPNDPWLKIDADTSIALRYALDRCGGQKIQIDYPLIIPYGIFRKEDECKTIAENLTNLPYTNLWLRVSGFGMSKASPAGLSKYIQSAWEFRSIGKPVITDGAAGLVGASIVAFGAAGGLCHGIAERENFNTSHWKKPSNGGGGSQKRIYLPEIDLYLYDNQAQTLLQGRGAKSLLACNEEGCCANGPQDMFEKHKAHALTQSAQFIDGFNQVPENRWLDHLISKHLIPTGRTLRKVEGIKLSDDKLMEKLKKQSHRLDLMHQAVDRLNEVTDEIPRSKKPSIRHVEFKSLGRIG